MLRLRICEATGLREAPASEIAEVVAKGIPAWIDITGPDDDEATLMKEILHFHPLAIEDTRNQRQRRPHYITRQMPGQEPDASAPTLHRADAEQRQEGRAGCQGVGGRGEECWDKQRGIDECG